MWNGFVGRSIAATTKNLRRIGVGLLLTIVAIGLFGARKLANVMQGPIQLDEGRLVSAAEQKYIWRDYATVEGTETASTGVTEIEKTMRNGAVESQRTTGEYMAVVVGKHILIVAAKPGVTSRKYSGTIVPLLDDLKSHIFVNEPDLWAATFPVMLDTTGLVLVALLLILGLWAIFLSNRRGEDPERHPLCKALSKYGPLYTLVPEIDTEFSAGASALSGVTFTQNWVIKCSVFQTLVMRRDEIVWVYKKRTKHSVNFIPTGTTFSSILRDSRGKLVEVSASEEHVNNLLAFIAQPMPWIIVGYDRKIEKLYKKQRQSFVETVTQRKVSMLSRV
jgi:hypothetical protein